MQPLSPSKRVSINNENSFRLPTENKTVNEPLNVLLSPKSPRFVSPVSDEHEYLNLAKKILSNGIEKKDRTGTGTRSLFGVTMKFNLSNNTMPLLTTKKVNWKSVVEELLWFISGSTDAKVLSDKGVKIWNANGTREFLDQRGLVNNREGDLGPVYGFQWRHFGAEYRGADATYTSADGVDQLLDVINEIKTNPSSRRIVLSAWNPLALSEMALPPCHISVQFSVNDGRLDSLMFQRSGDVGLGVPFNIASYALLTHMIAHLTNLKPGTFTHVIGDAHIYLNHTEALKKQVNRDTRLFPTIRFTGDIKTIEDFTSENIILEGYNPHPPIKMEMAV